MIKASIWLAAALAATSAGAQTPASQAAKAIPAEPATASAPEAVPSVEFITAMRDGVKLAADVYLPAGIGPWPVVLVRTPI